MGVTLRIDMGIDTAGKAASKAVSVQSDDEGFFVFSELPAGPHILIIDGATANRADATYGYFRRHIELPPNQHTHLKDPVWLAKLDPNGWIKIPSPLTQDLTLTTPHIPGWELHLPKGTVIRDHDGSVVTQLNISPIPVDRAPMPLPNFSVPVYFTVQPGGAWLQNIETQRQTGATIVYPNYYGEVPGAKAIFWHYDPLEKDWYPYGEGTVSENGKQVLPDAGVQIYDFAGAMISPGYPGPPGPPCKAA